MLAANVGFLLLIQVIILMIICMWCFQRYAKRWGTALGRDSVEGSYTRVDYIAGEYASYVVSYLYTVNGKKYFGSISRPALSFGLRASIDENIEILKKEYILGKPFVVFYYKESPIEHWLNSPPSKLLIFMKAIAIPLIVLLLGNVPLLFMDFLITHSPNI